MKKLWIIICIILSFLIIYLLQVNFFSWFNLAGVKPNLFVILALFIGLFTSRSIGGTFGIVFGISLDFFIAKSIGISGIMLGVIGILGGYLNKNFSKESRLTIITMVGLATLIYEVGVCLLRYVINETQITLIYFLRTVLIEIIFNAIITIIIYPLITKFGYKIEENFKENKILTRYF